MIVSMMLRCAACAGAALVTLSACSQPVPDGEAGARTQATSNRQMPAGAHILPETTAALLLSLSTRTDTIGYGGYWQPTADDVVAFETRLPAATQACLATIESSFRAPGWVRQYIGFVRAGRRTILGNFAQIGTDASVVDLDSQPYLVDDGGPHYFRAEFDLASARVIHVTYNGQRVPPQPGQTDPCLDFNAD